MSTTSPSPPTAMPRTSPTPSARCSTGYRQPTPWPAQSAVCGYGPCGVSRLGRSRRSRYLPGGMWLRGPTSFVATSGRRVPARRELRRLADCSASPLSWTSRSRKLISAVTSLIGRRRDGPHGRGRCPVRRSSSSNRRREAQPLRTGYTSGVELLSEHEATRASRGPTTAAIAGGRLLVVNSQFSGLGPGTAPFSVSSIPLPSLLLVVSASTSANARSRRLRRRSEPRRALPEKKLGRLSTPLPTDPRRSESIRYRARKPAARRSLNARFYSSRSKTCTNTSSSPAVQFGTKEDAMSESRVVSRPAHRP